jgi:Flp pilus assembly protein TadG
MLKLSRSIRSLFRDRSGNVVVEFALLMPAFVLALLLIIEIGNYLWTRNTVQNAAREAVRYGIVRSPWGTQWPGSAGALETAMETEALDKVQGAYLKPERATATATVDLDNLTVNVAMQYAYSPMVVPTDMIGTTTVNANETMDLHRP